MAFLLEDDSHSIKYERPQSEFRCGLSSDFVHRALWIARTAIHLGSQNTKRISPINIIMCISNFGRPPAPVLSAATAHGSNKAHSLLASTAAAKKRPLVIQHDYQDHAQDVCHSRHGLCTTKGGVLLPFPIRLHDMLQDVAKRGQDHIVAWQPHGRCFLIHNLPAFVQDILPRYFKLSKWPSFQRQLNLYGFCRLTRKESFDKGAYYHPLFLRGKVFLAHSMQRIKTKGTKVRPKENPEQEPDFWKDSNLPWVIDHDDNDGEARSSSTAVPSVAAASSSTSLSSQESSSGEAPSLLHALPPHVTVLAATTTAHQNQEEEDGLACLDSLLFQQEAANFFADMDWTNEQQPQLEDDEIFGKLLLKQVLD